MKMKITKWFRSKHNEFTALCKVDGDHVRVITHSVPTGNPREDLLNKCSTLLTNYNVAMATEKETQEMVKQYYKGPRAEVIAPVKNNTSKESLVERIATEGIIRTKLSQLQKQTIRLCERRGDVLYQCNSCKDHPFFIGTSGEEVECPWCNEPTKPHKHQP